MPADWPALNRIILAEHLRRYANISKAIHKKDKTEELNKKRAAIEERKKLFVRSHYLEREFDILELKILDAAKHGIYQVEVMRFDATYCTDGGRAINNYDKDWPTTLQGKAKDFYLIWKEYGRPKGYRLKAIIGNFPGGLPGDVSISIDWS